MKMKRLTLMLIVLPLACASAKDKGGDAAACTKGQADLAPRAAAYQGDAMTKRLIEADLVRARKEQFEGDADECVEALEHATKLLAGGE
jgi:hypothetical protein